ncbi:substrate-binding domain-containing protein [Vibrio breoganii]|uniref:AraC family transcriptional regulator n=1 Tax=Vibrio breoganii TaxID=553239 RepID=UPI0023EF557E|nr:substrate-binding domain-containing protein [Vibrio breoganii]
MENVQAWQGDGIIADFDNPEIERLLSNSNIPVVGVGGSYQPENDYPDVPYVATDNQALVEMAFKNIVAREGYASAVFRGNETSSGSWQYDMNRLADWLQRLPTPTGIIAVTDSRARHLLQVCSHLNIMVPDKVAVIGIDNEEVTRYLTRVSLSSVAQGSKEMGYRAAKMLHNILDTQANSENAALVPTARPRVMIPPSMVYERQSTDYQALNDPYVIQAMHFIRHNACKGIKVDQVLSYVGISRSNMEVRFKEARGHSIHQEIHNLKLKRACNLLTSTSLSINDIAEVCGYPSLQYMYTVFKKNFEMTPKDFREKPAQRS